MCTVSSMFTIGSIWSKGITVSRVTVPLIVLECCLHSACVREVIPRTLQKHYGYSWSLEVSRSNSLIHVEIIEGSGKSKFRVRFNINGCHPNVYGSCTKCYLLCRNSHSDIMDANVVATHYQGVTTLGGSDSHLCVVIGLGQLTHQS